MEEMENGIPGPGVLGRGFFLAFILGKGKKMIGQPQEGIKEIFVVKSERIDLFGAMVLKQGPLYEIYGRVRFQDGKVWYFHHCADHPTVLRDKLFALCETVAEFYGTSLFHQKFNGVIGYDRFIHQLREAKYELN